MCACRGKSGWKRLQILLFPSRKSVGEVYDRQVGKWHRNVSLRGMEVNPRTSGKLEEVASGTWKLELRRVIQKSIVLVCIS
jgi:hypothetical protein